MARASAVTGLPIMRREDPRFLTGATMFVAELTDERLADRAHVVFVRSPWAHAMINSIDTTLAREQPGVLGAFSSQDVDVFPAGRFARPIHTDFAQPLLAETKVRFAGEPVVAVVATSVAAALDAAESVDIEFEPLPPVLDLDHALAGDIALFSTDDRARLHPSAPVDPERESGNIAVDTGWHGSEAIEPSPFDTSSVMVRCRIMNPRQAPAPIEGRGVVAVWLGPSELRVWIATQRPHGFRDELCALYGLETDAVTVIAGPDVGGGFGGKPGRSPEERIMPFLARAVNRPVSWIETRSENLVASPQGRGERIDFVLAGTADGRIEALRAELVKDAGAYPITGAVLPAGYTIPSASGCYDIAHVEIRAISVATNRVATSAYRGAGRAPYIAGLERLIDLYAAEIDLDPAEVRHRNLVRPEQMPYTTPTGARYDEADYPGDLERALSAVGYETARDEQQKRRTDGAVRQLGIGLACYNHLTVGGGGEEAEVTLLPDGRARVVTGTTSQGHGHATTWAQIAADVLALPLDQIEVVEGSTEIIGSGVGAVGSRSAQTAGMAVHRAAASLVEEAKAIAAGLLEAAASDIVLGHDVGAFHVIGTPARTVSWADVAAVRRSGEELSCGDFYAIDGNSSFPSGTHVAVVEVDTETGAVQVLRFIAVDDAGARINPLIVEGQLHGGIAAGIGQALGETMVYDDGGNPLTSTFIDYAMPTADQLPSFELTAAGVPTSYNPLGVKGVGESGTIGATPAVHNAVIDAVRHLGVQHFDLPCTPHRVWEALSAKHQTPVDCRPQVRSGNFGSQDSEASGAAGG